MCNNRGSAFVAVLLITATLFGICASLLIIIKKNHMAAVYYVQNNKVFYRASGVMEQIRTQLEDLSQRGQVAAFENIKSRIGLIAEEFYDHNTEQLDLQGMMNDCREQYTREYTDYVSDKLNAIRNQFNTGDVSCKYSATNGINGVVVEMTIVAAEGGARKKILADFLMLSRDDFPETEFDNLINLGIINDDIVLENDSLVNVKMSNWREEITAS